MSEKMGIIGRKLGMTRIFAGDGSAVAVTVVKVGPCPVTQVKTVEKDATMPSRLPSTKPRKSIFPRP